MFAAYYQDDLDIGEVDVIMSVAKSVGLDGDEVAVVLDNGEYVDRVLKDEREAADLGIHAVPTFILNGAVRLEGAQPSDMLERAIESTINFG